MLKESKTCPQVATKSKDKMQNAEQRRTRLPAITANLLILMVMQEYVLIMEEYVLIMEEYVLIMEEYVFISKTLFS